MNDYVRKANTLTVIKVTGSIKPEIRLLPVTVRNKIYYRQITLFHMRYHATIV